MALTIIAVLATSLYTLAAILWSAHCADSMKRNRRTHRLGRWLVISKAFK